MTEFKTTCKLCGKEYDNYMRTFYVEENGIKIRVCTECRGSFCRDKYVYTNHIPSFCDGGDLISRCFNNEENLLEYILSNTKEEYICCMGDDGIIVDVSKNKKFWWVRGYSSLNNGLPNWKNKVKELYGEL